MKANSIVFCVLIALFALVSCGKSKQQIEEEKRQAEVKQKMDEESRKAAEARAQADAEKKALEEKEKAYLAVLLDQLRDPGSAQIRDLRFVNGKGGETLCGEVNAKNAYGGYVGFKPFAVTERQMDNTPSRVIVPQESDDWLIKSSDEIRLVNAGCR